MYKTVPLPFSPKNSSQIIIPAHAHLTTFFSLSISTLHLLLAQWTRMMGTCNPRRGGLRADHGQDLHGRRNEIHNTGGTCTYENNGTCYYAWNCNICHNGIARDDKRFAQLLPMMQVRRYWQSRTNPVHSLCPKCDG